MNLLDNMNSVDDWYKTDRSRRYRVSSASFEELLGKTISRIKVIEKDIIFFLTTDNEIFQMYHDQDCCEVVEIEDITGDLEDLIGDPILLAEEVSNHEDDCGDESCTWTFYKLATYKANVTIRWYGFSNGYYSEEVDFVRYREKY